VRILTNSQFIITSWDTHRVPLKTPSSEELYVPCLEFGCHTSITRFGFATPDFPFSSCCCLMDLIFGVGEAGSELKEGLLAPQRQKQKQLQILYLGDNTMVF
jgi:hypothetical protein